MSVTTGGITVPGLSVRRADTTVELASGQSFAIGGLLQSNTTDIISQVPGVGSIPMLGKLFSSSNYQNNKTELVIMVTPYLVEPTDPVEAAHAARFADIAEQRRRVQLQAPVRRRVASSRPAASRRRGRIRLLSTMP